MKSNKLYLYFGFFYLLYQRKYKEAFKHFVFSVLTISIYWFVFYKKHYLWKAKTLVEMGFVPRDQKDKEILFYFNIRKDFSDSGYIGISRTSSVDHKIGPSAADFERGNRDQVYWCLSMCFKAGSRQQLEVPNR